MAMNNGTTKSSANKKARMDAGLTQTEAAILIYCSLGAWQKWEQGDRTMHPAFWELFLIKTGQS